ncbi:MAG: phage holin family protein [Nostocoides sp.]|uniref:phage holin family protein n=1 Tax=Nostocoides sp. TaxID=1917966 RepID=UPI002BA640D7|nr:phage holin family protein [Tetrasphaera sp.]
MQNVLVKIGVNALALWTAALVVSGIRLGEGAGEPWSTRLLTILLVAVVFGLVNAVVKPIATVLSFPAIVLTLGLFTFIVNAFMLQITEWVSGAVGLDFTIDDFFWDAVMAALVITLVSMVLNFVMPDGD